jgi:peroxiredoxin
MGKLRKVSLVFFLSFFLSGSKRSEIVELHVQNELGQKVVLKPGNQNTVVNFWATWCASCKEELAEISSRLEDFDKANITLVLISVDSEIKTASSSKHIPDNLKKYVYYDPEMKLPEILELDSFPYSFLLDSKGKIIYEHPGYSPKDKVVDKILSHSK